jgi:hypothetical protein
MGLKNTRRSPLKDIITLWSTDKGAIPAGWHLCDGSDGSPNIPDAYPLAPANFDWSAYAGLLAVSGAALSDVSTSAELAGVISDETGSGLLVFNNSPLIITPIISGNLSISGDILNTTHGDFAIDATDGDGGSPDGATMRISAGNGYTDSNGGSIVFCRGLGDGIGANGKYRFTGTVFDAILNFELIAASDKIFTFPNLAGTIALTTNNLSVFAATTSLQLKGVISDETGSGLLVFNNAPTFIAPVLGAASCTTLNGLTPTALATGFTIAGGSPTSKTLTVSQTCTIDQNLSAISGVAHSLLTINQLADDAGIQINGYDDRSTYWFKLNIASSGAGVLDSYTTYSLKRGGATQIAMASDGIWFYADLIPRYDTTKHKYGDSGAKGYFNFNGTDLVWTASTSHKFILSGYSEFNAGTIRPTTAYQAVDASPGVSGSFTTIGNFTITVKNGLITGIV